MVLPVFFHLLFSERDGVDRQQVGPQQPGLFKPFDGRLSKPLSAFPPHRPPSQRDAS